MTDEPERLDAPNQQTVRPDGSHPADEGSGGSTPGGTPKRATGKAGKPAGKQASDTETAQKGS